MKKKVLSLILISALVFTLTGCTKTTTETVTDSNGNTTTTTTVEEKGETTTTVETSNTGEKVAAEAVEVDDSIVATLTIINSTGVDIAQLYFSSNDSDDWGNDICEGELFKDGESYVFEKGFTYSPDSVLWDIQAVDEEGGSIAFNGCDMSYAADCENIVITLAVDDDENSETGFCAYIE